MSYQMNKQKFLSDTELAELQRVLEKYATPRDRLLIELALACGMRACEVLAVHAKHLDAEDSTITIQGRKRGNLVVFPLDNGNLLVAPDLFKRLQALCAAAPNGKPFDISYRRLVQIWQEYTPNKHKTFHSLRHTFAIKFYKKGRDIKMVQTGLRHKSLASTMVYADFVESTEGLRGALK